MVTTRRGSRLMKPQESDDDNDDSNDNSNHCNKNTNTGKGAKAESPPPPPPTTTRKVSRAEALMQEEYRSFITRNSHNSGGAGGGPELLGRGHRRARSVDDDFEQEYLSQALAPRRRLPAYRGTEPANVSEEDSDSGGEGETLTVSGRRPERAAARHALDSFNHVQRRRRGPKPQPSSAFHFRNHPELAEKLRHGARSDSNSSDDKDDDRSKRADHVSVSDSYAQRRQRLLEAEQQRRGARVAREQQQRRRRQRRRGRGGDSDDDDNSFCLSPSGSGSSSSSSLAGSGSEFEPYDPKAFETPRAAREGSLRPPHARSGGSLAPSASATAAAPHAYAHAEAAEAAPSLESSISRDSLRDEAHDAAVEEDRRARHASAFWAHSRGRQAGDGDPNTGVAGPADRRSSRRAWREAEAASSCSEEDNDHNTGHINNTAIEVGGAVLNPGGGSATNSAGALRGVYYHRPANAYSVDGHETEAYLTREDLRVIQRRAKEAGHRPTQLTSFLNQIMGTHSSGGGGASHRERDPEELRMQERREHEALKKKLDRRYRYLLQLEKDGAGQPGGAAGGGSATGELVDVDTSITFDDVGGLPQHIIALKETVLLPLLYPQLFRLMHLTPPKGLLFVGPPGTGKTLLARALVAEGNRLAAASRASGGTGSGGGVAGFPKITFYMRKGADIFSKWMGESERQLTQLFEEARRNQPSIIFFDEIDGLAPARNDGNSGGGNANSTAAVVSTLLALLDGLESRGNVTVIGATNNPSALDSALRRPGRLDRELVFTVPDTAARRHILDICMRDIELEGGDRGAIADEMAELTSGYTGADLSALCVEAKVNRFRTVFPELYSGSAARNTNSNDKGNAGDGAGGGGAELLRSLQSVPPAFLLSSGAGARNLRRLLALSREDFMAANQRLQPSLSRGRGGGGARGACSAHGGGVRSRLIRAGVYAAFYQLPEHQQFLLRGPCRFIAGTVLPALWRHARGALALAPPAPLLPTLPGTGVHTSSSSNHNDGDDKAAPLSTAEGPATATAAAVPAAAARASKSEVTSQSIQEALQAMTQVSLPHEERPLLLFLSPAAPDDHSDSSVAPALASYRSRHLISVASLLIRQLGAVKLYSFLFPEPNSDDDGVLGLGSAGDENEEEGGREGTEDLLDNTGKNAAAHFDLLSNLYRSFSLLVEDVIEASARHAGSGAGGPPLVLLLLGLEEWVRGGRSRGPPLRAFLRCFALLRDTGALVIMPGVTPEMRGVLFACSNLTEVGPVGLTRGSAAAALSLTAHTLDVSIRGEDVDGAAPSKPFPSVSLQFHDRPSASETEVFVTYVYRLCSISLHVHSATTSHVNNNNNSSSADGEAGVAGGGRGSRRGGKARRDAALGLIIKDWNRGQARFLSRANSSDRRVRHRLLARVYSPAELRQMRLRERQARRDKLLRWQKIEYRRLQLRHVLTRWMSQVLASPKYQLFCSADLDLGASGNNNNNNSNSGGGGNNGNNRKTLRTENLDLWRRFLKFNDNRHMTLLDVHHKLEEGGYTCLSAFLDDIQLLTRNVQRFFSGSASSVFESRYRNKAAELREFFILQMYKINRNIVRDCELCKEEEEPPLSSSSEDEDGGEDAEGADVGVTGTANAAYDDSSAQPRRPPQKRRFSRFLSARRRRRPIRKPTAAAPTETASAVAGTDATAGKGLAGGSGAVARVVQLLQGHALLFLNYDTVFYRVIEGLEEHMAAEKEKKRARTGDEPFADSDQEGSSSSGSGGSSSHSGNSDDDNDDDDDDADAMEDEECNSNDNNNDKNQDNGALIIKRGAAETPQSHARRETPLSLSRSKLALRYPGRHIHLDTIRSAEAEESPVGEKGKRGDGDASDGDDGDDDDDDDDEEKEQEQDQEQAVATPTAADAAEEGVDKRGTDVAVGGSSGAAADVVDASPLLPLTSSSPPREEPQTVPAAAVAVVEATAPEAPLSGIDRLFVQLFTEAVEKLMNSEV